MVSPSGPYATQGLGIEPFQENLHFKKALYCEYLKETKLLTGIGRKNNPSQCEIILET